MAEESIGSFATYLETLHEKPPPEGKTSPPAWSLLDQLIESGEIALPELQRRSGMAFDDFAQAMTLLQRANLVELKGDAGNEVVQMTPGGASLAALGPLMNAGTRPGHIS